MTVSPTTIVAVAGPVGRGVCRPGAGPGRGGALVVHVYVAARGLGPVVVCVVEVPEGRVVPPAFRGVVQGAHAGVPLPDLVGGVACALQLGRHASHVARDGREPRHLAVGKTVILMTLPLNRY